MQTSTLLEVPRSSTNGLTVHCRSFHATGLKFEPKQWVSAWLSDSVRIQLKFSFDSSTLRPTVVAEMLNPLGPVVTTDIDEECESQILLPLWSHRVSSVMVEPATDADSTPAAWRFAPPAPILG